jgi:hypothetical protein
MATRNKKQETNLANLANFTACNNPLPGSAPLSVADPKE